MHECKCLIVEIKMLHKLKQHKSINELFEKRTLTNLAIKLIVEIK